MIWSYSLHKFCETNVTLHSVIFQYQPHWNSNEWMNEQTNEWLSEWMNEWVSTVVEFLLLNVQ